MSPSNLFTSNVLWYSSQNLVSVHENYKKTSIFVYFLTLITSFVYINDLPLSKTHPNIHHWIRFSRIYPSIISLLLENSFFISLFSKITMKPYPIFTFFGVKVRVFELGNPREKIFFFLKKLGLTITAHPTRLRSSFFHYSSFIHQWHIQSQNHLLRRPLSRFLLGHICITIELLWKP